MESGRHALFTLHNLGRAYGFRPSELAGVEDEWAAYQFDAAALTLGGRIQRALEANGAQKKNLRRPAEVIVREILEEKPEAKGTERSRAGFRDPRPFVSRKVRIPESGIW